MTNSEAKTHWNKSEITEAFEGCVTLRDVITHLELKFAHRGEVICEVRVNDMALSEEDEAKFADANLSDIESLAIATNKPLDLMREALQSAVGLVPQLEQSALTTAELIRSGETARAKKGFEETIEGCQWLVETLMHVRGASQGIGLELSKINAWIESEQIIGRVVNDVSAAHAKSDSILVADLLEYEMTAALASWRETIHGELDSRLAP